MPDTPDEPDELSGGDLPNRPAGETKFNRRHLAQLRSELAARSGAGAETHDDAADEAATDPSPDAQPDVRARILRRSTVSLPGMARTRAACSRREVSNDRAPHAGCPPSEMVSRILLRVNERHTRGDLSSAHMASDLRKREMGRRRVVLDWSRERGIEHMTFTVGETVVYPNHGAAVIEDIEMRTIKGEEKQYLVLRIVAQQDLVVRVPACNLDLVGVRDVVDKEGLERVFDVLRAVVPDEPTNWSRRYKANLEKLHSGDVMKVAEVVRDLWRRERDRGLSAGEKRMLAKARQILVSELALAEHTNEDKAEALLDEVLAS